MSSRSAVVSVLVAMRTAVDEAALAQYLVMLEYRTLVDELLSVGWCAKGVLALCEHAHSSSVGERAARCRAVAATFCLTVVLCGEH